MPDHVAPPRMMFVARRPLPDAARERIRATVEHWLRGNQPVLVVEDMDIYQLVDGHWQPVTPVTLPDASAEQIVTTEP